MPAFSIEPEGFAWLITADHVTGRTAGVLQPDTLTPDQQAVLLTPGMHLHRFYLYGPDGDLMYDGYGTWTHPEDEGTEPGLFAPLEHTWENGVDRITWPDFPDEDDPAQLTLDLSPTADPAPALARLDHLLAVLTDLAQLLPREELAPRITHNPELTATERAAALAELEKLYPQETPRA